VAELQPCINRSFLLKIKELMRLWFSITPFFCQ